MASRAERAGGGSVWGQLAFALAAAASVALLLAIVDNWIFTGAFAAGLLGFAAVLFLVRRGSSDIAEPAVIASVEPDLALLRAALDAAGGEEALALTGPDGRLVCANRRWHMLLGGDDPVAAAGEQGERVRGLARTARRDGGAMVDGLRIGGRVLGGDVRSVPGDHLLWRFGTGSEDDFGTAAARFLAGEAGRRAGEAGIAIALTDAEGTIRGANPAFSARAQGENGDKVDGTALVSYLTASEDGQFHFAAEGKAGPPLRIVQIPVSEESDALSLFLLLDDAAGSGQHDEVSLHALLDSLPLGLALVDGDGRFAFLNDAFRRAAGLSRTERPVWPGDLVVDEDKGAVSDSVRRFGRGRALSGDLAVRLKVNPEEPVAMTIAGARGLGNAAVLISLKDNSEEARLKREIAQATKMQAVGQLAGGVAHDFNNILTAILGTCDLMMMRHTPGDSDYDDIQQIRSNSNRAANLTRQLLAFSRQQTLRPQIVQLPDVVAEVSHLLTRLLGERIKLKVKHGRALGPVRADPGQLEQVIINLAVNARDAIVAKDPEGVGTLTLQTFAVTAEEVRRMGTDILPIADYTGLKVTDSGTGIPPSIIGKIFEPFFTTKEVGKGTGLGLSTVYGIVKQSGGFIFADSNPGKGTTFSIYLPVHRGQPEGKASGAKAKEKSGELWGTGTILIVEDETMVRTVAERALTRHGYNVLTAEDGEAALEILGREEKVDLLISDVVMPTMDGPTTVRAARKNRPDLPILFISGYAEEQLRKSIDIPNVSFLAKPFSVQQLAEAVRDVLAAK